MSDELTGFLNFAGMNVSCFSDVLLRQKGLLYETPNAKEIPSMSTVTEEQPERNSNSDAHPHQ